MSYNNGVEIVRDAGGAGYLEDTFFSFDMHQIVGSGEALKADQAPVFPSVQSHKYTWMGVYLRDLRDSAAGLTDLEKRFLITTPHIPLRLLYAQDFFSAFIWVVSSSINYKIPGNAEFLSPDAGSGFRANGAYWQRQPFKLRNPRIAEMAQIIQGSVPSPLNDAYQLLIPPLSTHGRLPLVGIKALIKLTRTKARPYKQLEIWDKAA